MILNSIAEKLKRQSKDNFKGRHFEAWLIVQAVTWYLRYPLSYRDLEEMLRERGLEADHSTINRWVLAYALVIESGCASFADRIVAQSGSTRPTSRSAARGAICTKPSTNTETLSTSCSQQSATSVPPNASSARCSGTSRCYRRGRSAPMAPTRFRQRLRRPSTMGYCIQIQSTMSPSFSNKALRATTFG